MNRALCVVALCAVANICFASSSTPDAAAVSLLATLKKSLPNTTITSVSASSVPGIYEVWMGANVAFVSPSAPTMFIVGRVIDTQSMTDITGPKLAAARGASVKTESTTPARIETAGLPLKDALKTVRGSGARDIYVFSDPACGYCRRLESELALLQDVTVYTFVVAFQGEALPRSILCSPDPQRAWDTVMQGGQSPSRIAAPCASPLERNVALARSLGVHGTPTIFYADGTRTSGYVASSELERRLLAAAPGQSKPPATVSMQKESLK